MDPYRLERSSSGWSPLWLFVAGVAVIVFIVLARAASGDRASGAWGLLGPLGLIVAALRGVQVRQDEAAAADRRRAGESADPPAPQWIGRVCPGCRTEWRGVRVAGRETTCPTCKAVLDDFAFRPPGEG